ncbi:ERMES complex subunit MDM34 [Sugiyamaella lignohabitans]|uniref:Mitochondrial distribution and morphology protein 34 n=1 Tax=Sugiyamaella lignohabitans TaxID=796027 RepID=A0A167EVQ3_9ASCO|nr:ERMES complex subunit MDM34 [Sugiyamaella lignohabitans]ANB14519.1 ERMES complex subunit MDM34 [Sugiyamaella lignohabitans]
MSFKFNWNSFNDESFYTRAKKLLTDALNKSNKPPIIVDKIIVQDLSLGSEAPDLEILEIGDLADDRFRGIFKLTYSGNASITLATKVQANPLNVYAQNAPGFCMPQFLGASSSLAMPLNLTLSDIVLSGIIILVFSKAKGLTLVFRNDPLEKIKVSSTFDALPGIAKFLQVQIENQIRVLFREELPTILHKLSQKWTPSGSEMSELMSLKSHTSSPISTEPSSPRLKPVSLMEINPDMPEFSPTNMLKLEALCASQRTLNLFTPAIPEAVYRSSLESFENARRKNGRDVQSLVGGDDLYDVMRLQTKQAQNRSSNITPKRRVIKIKRNKASDSTNSDTPSAEASAASTPISSSTPTSASTATSASSNTTSSTNTSSSLSPSSSNTSSNSSADLNSSKTTSIAFLPVIDESLASTSAIPSLDLKLPRQRRESILKPTSILEQDGKQAPSSKHEHEHVHWTHENALPKDKLFKDFFSRNVNIRPDDHTNNPPPPAYVA